MCVFKSVNYSLEKQNNLYAHSKHSKSCSRWANIPFVMHHIDYEAAHVCLLANLPTFHHISPWAHSHCPSPARLQISLLNSDSEWMKRKPFNSFFSPHVSISTSKHAFHCLSLAKKKDVEWNSRINSIRAHFEVTEWRKQSSVSRGCDRECTQFKIELSAYYIWNTMMIFDALRNQKHYKYHTHKVIT